jgi:ribonucleoside-diphosphate reductase beta chain
MLIYDETAKLNIGHEPMFLGTAKTLQRYDILKYTPFEDISETMLEDFWKKQEIKLVNDKADHDVAPAHIKHIFTMNIKRQAVLDTIQGRSLLATIGRVLTNSELEKALTILQQQEVNHSDTYTYILRNVYDNPSEVFNEILESKIITAHSKKIKQLYEDLYVLIAKWEYECDIKDRNTFEYKTKVMLSKLGLYHFVTIDELKKGIYLAIVAWNIIEGVRFFVSFACTFKMADNKIYMGNAQELRLIARDELNHLKISQKILRNFRDVEDEGFKHIVDSCHDDVMTLFYEAANDEIEWIHELFKNGNMLGLNANILTRYMKHITNVRLRAIGKGKLFNTDECEDLTYMNKWLGKTRVEELPQEIDSTQYKIGMTIPMSEEDWANLP